MRYERALRDVSYLCSCPVIGAVRVSILGRARNKSNDFVRCAKLRYYAAFNVRVAISGEIREAKSPLAGSLQLGEVKYDFVSTAMGLEVLRLG